MKPRRHSGKRFSLVTNSGGETGRNGSEARDDRSSRSGLPSGPVAPATEAQIAREEARLGVRLPPSLRSFYLTSNGYGMAGGVIWSVRSVEQIGWLCDVVPFLYDIVFEEDPAVGRSLVVSGESDAAWWLLDPGDADERGEWPAGRWASWNPGMSWMAKDFIGLFEAEVSLAERVLAEPPFFFPFFFEREVAANLSWTIDPPTDARFNTDFT